MKKPSTAASDAAALVPLTQEEQDQQRKERFVKIKEQADRETKLTKFNSHVIDTKYRDTLRKKKADSLRVELDESKKMHDWTMDTKEAFINGLDQELQEAESQLNAAMNGYFITQQDILSVQSDRIVVAHQFFTRELSEIQTEFETEKAKMEANHGNQMQSLSNVVTRLDRELQEAEADTKHEFQSQRDDARNRSLEEKQTMRIQAENQLEDLWKQFQKALDDYNQATEDRRDQFEMYRKKDTENSKMIEMQTNKLLALQESVTGLKSKLQSNNLELEERNSNLRVKKDALQGRFQQMKRELGAYREGERGKLKDLARTASKVMKSFNDRVELAEDIIRLAELNSKLETERETIAPFADDEVAMAEEMEKESSSEEKLLAQVSDLSEMERQATLRFYHRFNRARITHLLMKQKRERLRAENQQLKMQLRHYFESMSVSESILAKNNALVVVNGHSNVKHEFKVDKTGAIKPTLDGPMVQRSAALQRQ